MRKLDRDLFEISEKRWYWQAPGVVQTHTAWRGEEDVDQFEQIDDQMSLKQLKSDIASSRREQHSLGLTLPQRETYETFIHELGRGASGEFSINHN